MAAALWLATPEPGVAAVLGLNLSGGRAKAAAALTVEEWREDVFFLAERMVALHPNLFYSVSRDEFEDAVNDLANRIPELSDNQIVVGFYKVAALPFRNGRDGHSGMAILDAQYPGYVPVLFHVFPDGLFVIHSTSENEPLIGKRVLRVGSTSIEEVFETLDPLIARDNSGTDLLARLPFYLMNPQVLEGVGLIEGVSAAEFLMSDANGAAESVELVEAIPTIEFAEYVQNGFDLLTRPEPLYLSNLAENFWFVLLDGSPTLYVRYNAILGSTQSGETLAEFAARLTSLIDSSGADKLVIDLRFNGGGDNTTFEPLLRALESSRLNVSGRLFAIIGRHTFSAAGNFVTEIQKRTEVLLAGEATGGAPNQYGDAVAVQLPNSGYTASVSTIYHQRSTPDDPRLTHEPDIPVPMTSQDFFSGRDPVLEAVVTFAPATTRLSSSRLPRN